MRLDFNNEKSIYLQIAENIEDDILSGAIAEETQIPSTNQLAVILKINPATAAKGIAMLADGGVVYKKRGIGMFVTAGARDRIMENRRREFFDRYVSRLLEEARRIGISREELIQMIDRGKNDEYHP